VPVEEPSTASKADMTRLNCDVRFTPESGAGAIPAIFAFKRGSLSARSQAADKGCFDNDQLFGRAMVSVD
jgi:hypothetical protein